MKKSLKKLIAGTGIVAAGAAVAGTIHRYISKYMMKVALDREAPKAPPGGAKMISGTENENAYAENAELAAESLKSQTNEVVEILSHDGTRLVGHWFEAQTPKRVIIAMHGWRSSWDHDFGMIAPFWFQNDCTVLFPEQRGQGESGGEYMGFGLLERYDCLDWINWVNERTEERFPIYLGGVSMGATTVLMTGGFELPENVCGIVADCGFTSPQAIWKHVAQNNLHLPYGMYQGAADDLCKQKIHVSSESYSAIDAMKQCKVPVLFIHGTDDRFVPVEMTYENYKACSAPKSLLVVPGAEHGMSYLVDTAAYQKALQEFWNKYDFEIL